jgi:hypothetical protein
MWKAGLCETTALGCLAAHTCIDEGVGAQHHVAQLRVPQHAALADQRVVELAVADDGWRAE